MKSLSLSQRIDKMEKRVQAMKKRVPSDIGNYIINNFKIIHTNKDGSKSKRNIRDSKDFKKHFKIVKRSKDTVNASIVKPKDKSKDKNQDKNKNKNKNNDKHNNFNNKFNNNRF